jgi:hypothetical protein
MSYISIVIDQYGTSAYDAQGQHIFYQTGGGEGGYPPAVENQTSKTISRFVFLKASLRETACTSLKTNHVPGEWIARYIMQSKYSCFNVLCYLDTLYTSQGT